MNRTLVDQIAQAVLYEGYLLYPYRPSVKNRQRWTFGGLYPESYSRAQEGSDPWTMQTECVVLGDGRTSIGVTVRFLHLMMREVGEVVEDEAGYRLVDSLRVGETDLHAWQEAVEREFQVGELDLAALAAGLISRPFGFPPSRAVEAVNGTPSGVIVRTQETLEGAVELSAERAGEGAFKVTVRVLNRTPFEGAGLDEALMRAMASTHAVLTVREGAVVSLIDPPDPWREAAAGCRNVGAWPVLVGAPGDSDTMLAAPIILYDYPEIAPESPGDLFDATEIDEILTLRILTLTEDEKRAMAAVDARARSLLERTESLAVEQLMGLHGTIRGLRPR